MDVKKWKVCADIFEHVFGLEQSPVAVSCIKNFPFEEKGSKVRICRGILDAAAGNTIKLNKKNNMCFGASWHLGFQKIKDPQAIQLTRQFVVEGEKLFSSYESLDRLIAQMEDTPDNSESTFVLTPLQKIEHEPQLVIFTCNAEQACRLLTVVTFIDGVMPKIKIGGPTCRMAIMYPLLKGEVNISFQDYTARKMCAMDKNLLFVIIPANKIPSIIESIDRCSAGTAKIEYPQGFREFLQKRNAKSE